MRSGRTMVCVMVLVLLLCQGSFTDLLFKSGFESDTQVTTPETYSNSVSIFSGTDNSTGYTWPINLGPFMDPDQTGVQNLFANGNAPSLGTYYMEATIETVTGPHGTPTKVLHMNWKEDNPTFGPDQHNFKLGFLSEPSDSYYKYWIKFDTRMMGDCRQTENYWRHVWEMKACTPRDDPRDQNCHIDQRIICRIEHDPVSGEPDWTFLVDYYEPKYGDVFYQRCPMTPSETKRLENGGWLLMEFFFHRNSDQTSNGRFVWKIDGRTLVDKQDLTFWGTLGKTQVFHMPFMIYAGSSLKNGELWVDDLEIHDSIPAATECALSASPSSVEP